MGWGGGGGGCEENEPVRIFDFNMKNVGARYFVLIT